MAERSVVLNCMMQFFSCHLSLVTCHASCYLSLVTCHASCYLSRSIAFRQAQHKVADDVALDFAGACFDGVAARPQIAVRPFAVINRLVACAAELPIRTEHFHCDLLHSLIHLAPE